MNNIFKKDKIIVLDDKYSLTNDGGNGIQLIFKETRQKEKKDSKLLEDYEYTESLYFTRINQALNKYVELTQNNFKDLEDLISRTDKPIYSFRQFPKGFHFVADEYRGKEYRYCYCGEIHAEKSKKKKCNTVKKGTNS